MTIPLMALSRECGHHVQRRKMGAKGSDVMGQIVDGEDEYNEEIAVQQIAHGHVERSDAHHGPQPTWRGPVEQQLGVKR